MTATRTARKPSAADKAAKAAAYTALADQLEAFEEELEHPDGEAADATLAAVEHFAAKYSLRNSMLIVMQYPTATEVAGFRAWQEKGRQVRKGEHGIRILAPAGSSTGTDAIEASDDGPAVDGKPGRRFFRLISVFDIRQTDEVPAS